MKKQMYYQEAWQNLIRLKDRLIQSGSGKEGYNAFVHKRTGALAFQGRGPESIPIHLALETRDGRPLFLLQDLHGRPVQERALDSLAWKVIQETFDSLNHIHSLISYDLSQIEVVRTAEQIEHLPGWKGKMDREAAEHKLQNQPVGSYLFRQSEACTEAAVTQLEHSNQMSIQAYLCTIVEPHGVVADLLLLHTCRGWVLYHDNPDLTDPEYVYSPSVHNLLAEIHKRARYPV